MTKQTYENYYKEYYHKNKEKINARRKEYNNMCSKRWYYENKDRINAENRKKTLEKQKKALLSQNLWKTWQKKFLFFFSFQLLNKGMYKPLIPLKLIVRQNKDLLRGTWQAFSEML